MKLILFPLFMSLLLLYFFLYLWFAAINLPTNVWLKHIFLFNLKAHNMYLSLRRNVFCWYLMNLLFDKTSVTVHNDIYKKKNQNHIKRVWKKTMLVILMFDFKNISYISKNWNDEIFIFFYLRGAGNYFTLICLFDLHLKKLKTFKSFI